MGLQQHDADNRFAERRGEGRRQRSAAEGRVRRLLGALGPSRRRRRRSTATRSTTARSTTRRASPRCSRWHGRSCRASREPKRSILFLFVTAEEQGLLGSEYYATHPLYPLEKTVANINMDGVNQWGRTSDITVVGMGASDLDDVLRAAAAEQNRTLTRTRSLRRASTTGRTISTSRRSGVPALYTDSGDKFIGKDGRIQHRRSATSTRRTTITSRRITSSLTGISAAPSKTRSCCDGGLPRRQRRPDPRVEAGE